MLVNLIFWPCCWFWLGIIINFGPLQTSLLMTVALCWPAHKDTNCTEMTAAFIYWHRPPTGQRKPWRIPARPMGQGLLCSRLKGSGRKWRISWAVGHIYEKNQFFCKNNSFLNAKTIREICIVNFLKLNGTYAEMFAFVPRWSYLLGVSPWPEQSPDISWLLLLVVDLHDSGVVRAGD